MQNLSVQLKKKKTQKKPPVFPRKGSEQVCLFQLRGGAYYPGPETFKQMSKMKKAARSVVLQYCKSQFLVCIHDFYRLEYFQHVQAAPLKDQHYAGSWYQEHIHSKTLILLALLREPFVLI